MNGKEPVKLAPGDGITLKKPHPCGSVRAKVLRAGVDVRLKCEGCGHEWLMPRVKLTPHIVRVEHKEG